MRVLVVSESMKERQRATSALRLHEDLEVVEVPEAREARRRAVQEDFDVLVIDGDLQPKGGFSLLYEIRQQAEQEGETSPPAVVMIAREQDRWLGTWAGANRTILKPVDPFRLTALVKEVADEDAAEPQTGTSVDEVQAARSTGGTAGLAPSA